MPSASAIDARILGRYALCDEIASGGTATVHIGRLLGAIGFSRTVAIKRLHPPYAKDPHFVSMFLDEARLAARIRHPNVVGTLDVVALAGELFLVMEYVPGESLARLMHFARDQKTPIPLPITASILIGVLNGLHAAHEATNDRGEALGIVHRDVSPQNILVGTDGVARVLDFGIAKAVGRIQTTREGSLKGKLCYMAPEQVRGDVDRRTDVYAASVVLWEAITGRRLFFADDAVKTLALVLAPKVERPSAYVPLPSELEQVVLRGLAPDPTARFASAREMARALENGIRAAPAGDVSDWLETAAEVSLASRRQMVASIESATFAHANNRELVATVSETGIHVGTQNVTAAPVRSSDAETLPEWEAKSRPRRGRRAIFLAACAAGLAGGAGTSVHILDRPPTSHPSPEARAAAAPRPELAVESAAPVRPPELATQPPNSTAAAPSSVVRSATVRRQAPPSPSKPEGEFDHVIDSRK